MIDPDIIERLIKALDESGVDSLEIERGGTRVRLSKTPLVQPAAPVGEAAAAAIQEFASATPGAGSTTLSANLLEVESPMVGTFFSAPAPDAPAYVENGSRVAPGDTLCIIEAMKLMNELECEVTGTIVEICVENAQPVEFGQVLFRVDPA